MNEWFITWAIGVFLMMIVMVARYHLLADGKHIGDHLFEGPVQYAILWPACIPAHVVALVVVKAGRWLATQYADGNDAIKLRPTGKEITK